MKTFVCIFLFYFFQNINIANDSSLYKNKLHDFSIQKASKSHTFLYQEQILQIHKHAIIGVINEKQDFYSFVLINKLKSLNLKQFSQKIIHQLDILDIYLTNYKDYKHQSYEALSFNLTGNQDGHHILYEVNLIKKNDIVYQLYSILIDHKQKLIKLNSLKPRLILHDNKTTPTQNINFEKDWVISNQTYYNQSQQFSIDLQNSKFKQFSCNHGLICLKNEDQMLLFQSYPKSTKVFSEFLTNFAPSIKKIEFLTKNKSSKIYLIKNKKDKVFYHLFIKKDKNKKVLIAAKSNSYLDHNFFQTFIDTRVHWTNKKSQPQSKSLFKTKINKNLHIDNYQSFYKNQYRNFKAGLEINFPKKEQINFEINTTNQNYIYSEFYLNNLTKNYSLEAQVLKFETTRSELNIHKDRLKKLTQKNIDNIQITEYLAIYYSEIKLNNKSYFILTRKHYNSLFYAIFKGNPKDLQDLLKHFHFLELNEIKITKKHYYNHKLQFSFLNQKNIVQELISNQKDIHQVKIKNKLSTHILYIAPTNTYTKDNILKIFNDDQKVFGLNLISTKQKSYLGYEYDYDQYKVSYPNKKLKLIQQTLKRGNLLFSIISTGNKNILNTSFIHHHQLMLNNTITK
ncbi:MAG: hypothetical protein COB02_16295 [Candidatus Cloacimonadota bacterium]|nr:MAG: hypothetical protein COB02_16295 [Candidatus Cloacimonadota bacterium]